MSTLFTIGYERATQPEVIARLRDAGVATLIDVRAVAASRRAGFAKSLLAGGLAEAGIGYVHLRELGTPKAGREAAKAGRVAEMQAIFAAHMATPEAEAGLARAIAIAREGPVCLLCLEAEAHRCHRAIVARMMRREMTCEIVDL